MHPEWAHRAPGRGSFSDVQGITREQEKRDLRSACCAFLTGHCGSSHIEVIPRLALRIRPAVAIFGKAAGTQRLILAVRNPDPTDSFLFHRLFSLLQHFLGGAANFLFAILRTMTVAGDGGGEIDEFCFFSAKLCQPFVTTLIWSNNLLDIGLHFPFLANAAFEGANVPMCQCSVLCQCAVCRTFYTFH